MNALDSMESLREFWLEFTRVKTGIVGLAILGTFVLLGVFGIFLVPFPDAIGHWRDINYWQDNPQASPPVWTNAFTPKKGVVSSFLGAPKEETRPEEGDVTVKTYTFDYSYVADQPPRDLILRVAGEGPVPVVVSIKRPDGKTAEIFRSQMELSKGKLERVSIARSSSQEVIEFLRAEDEGLAGSLSADLIKPLTILFSKIDADVAVKPSALKGDYRIIVSALILSPDFKVDKPSIIVSGHVSGILGTDAMKRDIFTGIIVGIRWALIIGILTSVVSVAAGVLLGIVAAYFGGAVDWALTRLYELVYLLPVLPFLIVVSAVFKPSIWTFIAIICLFFWTGSYKTVYSMTLQIKEETYVEAARALGSSRWRIVFKHISPILLPYSFASMALSIPAIIVYEASVSLLGLGDATIVSWGQILEAALSQGAVINNLWWWVIPPGLAIALMGMSFAFLGTALDKILHPKLKTR
jgi:peptide/nickel transport system permease protein